MRKESMGDSMKDSTGNLESLSKAIQTIQKSQNAAFEELLRQVAEMQNRLEVEQPDPVGDSPMLEIDSSSDRSTKDNPGGEITKGNPFGTNAIHVGDVFKNYEAMCEALNDKKNLGGGKMRQDQIKRWARYFSWEKQGHKYLVTEVKDISTPKPLHKNQIYIGLLETILLSELSKAEGLQLFLTKNGAFKLLGMIPEEYDRYILDERKKALNDKLKALRQEEASQCEMYCFYVNVNKYLSGILTYALKIIKGRGFIDYVEETVIAKKIIDEHGKEVIKSHIASKAEKSDIYKVKQDVVLELGFNSIQSTMLSGKGKELLDKTNVILAERFNWEYVYRSLVVQGDQAHISKAELRENTSASGKFSEAQLELNRKICAGLEAQANRKHLRAIALEKKEGVKDTETRSAECKDTYVPRQKALIELLVRIAS